MPGALVVMMDAALEQIALPLDALGLERSYRIGPASRPLGDPSQRDISAVFQGVGLRPYRPAHLRARWDALGDVHLTWVRRTRRGGDGWGVSEVPLSETYERYVVRVRKGGAVLRVADCDAPGFVYSSLAQLQDGVEGSFTLEVAQVSDVFGPGPFASLEIAL